MKFTNIKINELPAMKKAILFTWIFLSAFFSNRVVYSQPDREKWQPPEKIMEAIGVKSGMIIGEVGAGRGYMTFPLVKKLGQSGKLYANDISTDDLDYLKNKAKTEEIKNLFIVEGTVDDPMFPVKDLDMIILVYVFHDLEKPIEFTRNVEKYLKDSGSLVLLERDPEKVKDAELHFLRQADLLEKMEQTGFKLLRTETFLEKDNIYIFGKKI